MYKIYNLYIDKILLLYDQIIILIVSFYELWITIL